jgi:hypothetical protein
MPIETPGLSISPDSLSFGCVCQGFVYQLSIQLTNKLPTSQRLKFTCNAGHENEANAMTVIVEPVALALGMTMTIILELRAYAADMSYFQLNVCQSGFPDDIVTLPLEAFVVPLDVFKLLKRALTLEKRDILRKNVVLIGSTLSADERSAATGGPTVYSEALMDDDQVEDLLDLPLVLNVYWDPNLEELKYSRELGKV